MQTVMKRLLAAMLLSFAATRSATAAAAGDRHLNAEVSVLFRLRVDGAPGRNATFWVAYGPLAGTWGIKQLHAAGPRFYAERLLLPRGRATFSFIQGTGIEYTRLGAVPGNPVLTIRHIGPAFVGGSTVPTVVWHEPIG